MAHPVVPALIEEVTRIVGVLPSATAFINGVPGLIQAGVDAALSNGATAAELEPLTALEAELETKGNDIVAALQANAPPGDPSLRRR
jgi:hypothetical protein